eukprot:866225-Pleurochrysis_carterae.AAC.3
MRTGCELRSKKHTRAESAHGLQIPDSDPEADQHAHERTHQARSSYGPDWPRESRRLPSQSTKHAPAEHWPRLEGSSRFEREHATRRKSERSKSDGRVCNLHRRRMTKNASCDALPKARLRVLSKKDQAAVWQVTLLSNALRAMCSEPVRADAGN